ncbi:MAG: TIR domain-containing protein [Oscillospiraceae bacterium]|nr:TIR domain-containing protein [Oscillospiraceae bacterium]
MEQEVFISYSHYDAETADAVCEFLEKEGIGCWYAPRNIGPGEEWAASIMNALNACRIMILIFSGHSNASVQVLREVDKAVSLRKIIIPYRITDTEPTEAMDYYLSTLRFQEACGISEKKALSSLLERVQNALAGKEKPAPSARKQPDAEKLSVKQIIVNSVLSFLLIPTGLILLFTVVIQSSFRNETMIDLLGLGAVSLICGFFALPFRFIRKRFKHPRLICTAASVVILIFMFIFHTILADRAPGVVNIPDCSQETSMNTANYSFAVRSEDGFVYFADISSSGNPVIRRCSLESFLTGGSGEVLLSDIWADNFIPLKDGRLVFRDFTNRNYKMKILDPDTGKVTLLKRLTTSNYCLSSDVIFYGEELTVSHGVGVITLDGRYDYSYMDFLLSYPYFYEGDIYYISGTDGTGSLCSYLEGTDLSYDIRSSFIIYDDEIYFCGTSGGIYKAPLSNLRYMTKLCSDTPYGFVASGDWLYFLNQSDNMFLYRVPLAGGDPELVDMHSHSAINVIDNCLYLSDNGLSYTRLLTDGI